MVDFEPELLLALAQACGDDERYDGIKSEFYQGLEAAGGIDQDIDADDIEDALETTKAAEV